MKKSIILLLLMLIFVSFSNTVMASENELVPNTTTIKKEKIDEIPADVQIMLNRLEDIKAIDKSVLKSAEKKELRAEVREIKSTLRASGNGLYISSGAIIIILLLIIIL